MAAGQRGDGLTPYFLRAADEVRRNMQLVVEAAQAADARMPARAADPYARYYRQGPDEDEAPPSA